MNNGQMYIMFKPLSERKISADQVIQRLRKKLAVVPGATLYLQAKQDIRVGGRSSNAQYEYTLERKDESLTRAARCLNRPTGQGSAATLVIDRDTASRLGLNTQTIDNTLYDAFGQRQVSTV